MNGFYCFYFILFTIMLSRPPCYALRRSRENLVLRASLDPTRTSAIPNAVDTRKFTPDPSRRKPANTSTFEHTTHLLDQRLLPLWPWPVQAPGRFADHGCWYRRGCVCVHVSVYLCGSQYRNGVSPGVPQGSRPGCARHSRDLQAVSQRAFHHRYVCV